MFTVNCLMTYTYTVKNLECSETALVSIGASPALMAPLCTRRRHLGCWRCMYSTSITHTLTYTVCVPLRFFITSIAITMIVTAVAIHTKNATATDPPIIAVVVWVGVSVVAVCNTKVHFLSPILFAFVQVCMWDFDLKWGFKWLAKLPCHMALLGYQITLTS